MFSQANGRPFGQYYKDAWAFVRWHLRKIFGVLLFGAALLFAFQFGVVHRWFPDALSEILPIDRHIDVLLVTLLLVLIELALSIEDAILEEKRRSKSFWVHPEQQEAFDQVSHLIRGRGDRIKRADLLQFSGATVMPVLKELARHCPNAKVRLLLVPKTVADKYDEPGFHWTRIQSTLDQLMLLSQEDFPGFDIEVWFYETAPAIAGIIIDDWLVTAGWYHELPIASDPAKRSIRGHKTTAIVAFGEDAFALLSMVNAQFNAAMKSAARIDLSKRPWASLQSSSAQSPVRVP